MNRVFDAQKNKTNIILKIGKLYFFESSHLFIFPDKKSLIKIAVDLAVAARVVVPYGDFLHWEKYWSDFLRTEFNVNPKLETLKINEPFLLLKADTENIKLYDYSESSNMICVQILANYKKGWLLFEDRFGIKELKNE